MMSELGGFIVDNEDDNEDVDSEDGNEDVDSENGNEDVDSEDGLYHDDSLHQAVCRGDVDELELLLSRSKENIDLQQLMPFIATLLRLAAICGHPACVALLLKYGADVDHPVLKGQAALFCAMGKRNTECCILLLEAGARLDDWPYSPLYAAFRERYAVGVKLLLDYGVHIDRKGYTWLNHAVRCQHLSIFILLLEGGANVACDEDVLHDICTEKCNPQFVHLWVLFGGSLWCKNKKGERAIDLTDNPHTDLLQKLMSEPMSLLSQCRLKIRRIVGRKNLHRLHTMDLPNDLQQFLRYRDVPEVNFFMSSIDKEIQTVKSKLRSQFKFPMSAAH